jgi:hypothetical protein
MRKPNSRVRVIGLCTTILPQPERRDLEPGRHPGLDVEGAGGGWGQGSKLKPMRRRLRIGALARRGCVCAAAGRAIRVLPAGISPPAGRTRAITEGRAAGPHFSHEKTIHHVEPPARPPQTAKPFEKFFVS